MALETTCIVNCRCGVNDNVGSTIFTHMCEQRSARFNALYMRACERMLLEKELSEMLMRCLTDMRMLVR